ncbi:MAG TPA: DUF2971 domain-containing protein [Verrucomicrobiae bacterium]|nr:DUF2971 domain-containing protein [Verrucomicrobiae bacterium]
MKVVYKYCNAHGVDILQNLELKITPPNQFNDPFELTPQMICSNPTELAARWKELNLPRIYSGLIKSGKFKGDFSDFERSFNLHHGQWLSQRMIVAPSNVQKRILNLQSEANGLLCMSKRRDSILMWGHYCDKHRGLVVAFDHSYEIFQSGTSLFSVSYVPKRILWEFEWKVRLDDLKTQDALVKTMSSKSEDWRYEQELRQVFSLSELKKKMLGKKKVGYFHPISSRAIVGVSLGVRCSKNLEKKVRSLLKRPHLSHIKLDRAVLHETDFALEFVNC